MEQQDERQTPPKQTPEDPNLADRRLSDEQNREMKDEPAPPARSSGSKENKGSNLPDPKEVGEAG
jgi:hypothetical protein